MAVSPGTTLGSFEVFGLSGVGGVGEVDRARDTKLGREAAIKVLPEAFAKDADRLARFDREAKLLAAQDVKGQMKNTSLLDYRMPTSPDLPRIDTVIVEVANPGHPFGVRGVGEANIIPPPPSPTRCTAPRGCAWSVCR